MGDLTEWGSRRKALSYPKCCNIVCQFLISFSFCHIFIRVLYELKFNWYKLISGIDILPIYALVVHIVSIFTAIGRSEGSSRDAFTLAIQFLSFSCSFWQTFCQMIGWCSPLWEILDLPLIALVYQVRTSYTWHFSVRSSHKVKEQITKREKTMYL